MKRAKVVVVYEAVIEVAVAVAEKEREATVAACLLQVADRAQWCLRPREKAQLKLGFHADRHELARELPQNVPCTG